MINHRELPNLRGWPNLAVAIGDIQLGESTLALFKADLERFILLEAPTRGHEALNWLNLIFDTVNVRKHFRQYNKYVFIYDRTL